MDVPLQRNCSIEEAQIGIEKLFRLLPAGPVVNALIGDACQIFSDLRQELGAENVQDFQTSLELLRCVMWYRWAESAFFAYASRWNLF